MKNVPQIIDAFKNAFKLKAQRNFLTTYIAIDLHGTIITPEYNPENKGATIYPFATEVLKYWTKRDDIKLILWTSSYLANCEDILRKLFDIGVDFDYFNENPLEVSSDLCDFSKKFYFNILIDDKAGFDPKKDWTALKKYFNIPNNPREFGHTYYRNNIGK